MSRYLIEKIISITKDDKSISFWKKVINILGENIVDSELGELKYQIHVGNVRNPAKYLTTLLKNRLEEFNIDTEKALKSSHFENTPIELFKHLATIDIPINRSGIIKNMELPYSKKRIPWPTFLGPEYFKLSTNNSMADVVNSKIRGLDGSKIEVNLLRGKLKPSDKPRGIPSVQHMKVFAALEAIWTQSKGQYIEYDNDIVICNLQVTAREIARTLGWKTFSGKHLSKITRIIGDLKSMPYYIMLKDDPNQGNGFYLLGDVILRDRITQGGKTIVFDIYFSTTVSYQLLKRHTVLRSLKMLQLRSELATLLWLYIEPILRRHKNVSKELNKLIDSLQLITAGWHKSKSNRKQQFQKAVEELNGKLLEENMKMNIWIEKGNNDWKLVANLSYIENTKIRISPKEKVCSFG